MIKEVNLKHFAGPFTSIPSTNYIQSLAGLVPKKSNETILSSNTNKDNAHNTYDTSDNNEDNKANIGQPDLDSTTRLIFHLSWPPGESLNNYMPDEKGSVKYNDLDKAIQLCLEVINNDNNPNRECYLAKTDIKSAFRHLPIRKQDWCWLVLMAQYPVTNEKFYFVDK